MEQMMSQFGIDMEDIDAERVVIETTDGDLVFTDAEVTMMNAQGQSVYQVIGEPDEAPQSENETDEESGLSDRDVEVVAEQAGVTEEQAREALADADGDLADAVEQLS